MKAFFDFAVTFASCCFVGAMLIALIRAFLGPSAQDRVLAFDTFYLNGMLTLLMLGIRSGTEVVFRCGAADRVVRLRRYDGTRQIPAARRGDRTMSELTLPLWAAVPAAILLICGGLLALIGSLGLLRMKDFYARMHPPTLGTTLGTVACSSPRCSFPPRC